MTKARKKVPEKSDQPPEKGGRALKRLEQQRKARGLPPLDVDSREGVLDLETDKENGNSE